MWGIEDFKKNKPFLKRFKKNLHIFGHPKFDILKKTHIKFYQKEINKLKKKYGKFVFISSSFPVDQIMNQSAFNKFRFDNFFFVMEKKKDFIKKDFDNYLKGEKKLFKFNQTN